ncbi:L,D-transpeptidase family protein [Stenotrophomonas sp. JAI102]|uniref:L,D-transpeptidase family protein n=1 Tax=Stenotrophomonas sp. JAI102 TaxID=2723077 RepID=UPI0015C736D7|nr:L,D-transpeptidase family protein [Stenotrophomonas sp. JAI102]NYF37664.1 L,D-peptidoglycan transpeptidase YkuD (ErfK/YbiS/YcfS/YnhG family) [Stenotrophomonas sp. JAI102]
MLPLLRTALAVTALAAALPAAALTPAPPMAHSRQAIVVVTDSWDASHGRLQAYERKSIDGAWRPHGPAFTVAVGRNGSAWGLGRASLRNQLPQKKEGDGRSPAGIFEIGPAFGYAPTIASAMPYQPMTASHYCMDVPGSRYYNRIVDAQDVGVAAVKGSTEPMRLDLHNKGDVRYREGFVIEHNSNHTPGAGSCIFAHLWRTPGEATAGCTAMQPQHMKALLAWLKPDTRPAFVLLPKDEYEDLQVVWELPALSGAKR